MNILSKIPGATRSRSKMQMRSSATSLYPWNAVMRLTLSLAVGQHLDIPKSLNFAQVVVIDSDYSGFTGLVR